MIIDLSAETETGKMGAVNVINGKINSRTTAVNLTLTGIKTIPEYAFFQCKKLASLNLPDVTSIGKEAFYECTALTSVSLPSVITIAYGAFWRSALTSLNLPAAVNIGDHDKYRLVNNQITNRFGLTNAELSVAYHFSIGKNKK